jgi:hypothetical protein
VRNLESNALILVRRQALADVSLCFSCVCCFATCCSPRCFSGLLRREHSPVPRVWRGLTQACTSTCVPQEGLLNEVVYPLLTVQVGNTTSMRERFGMSVFLFTGVYAALHLHAFGWGKP